MHSNKHQDQNLSVGKSLFNDHHHHHTFVERHFVHTLTEPGSLLRSNSVSKLTTRCLVHELRQGVAKRLLLTAIAAAVRMVRIRQTRRIKRNFLVQVDANDPGTCGHERIRRAARVMNRRTARHHFVFSVSSEQALLLLLSAIDLKCRLSLLNGKQEKTPSCMHARRCSSSDPCIHSALPFCHSHDQRSDLVGTKSVKREKASFR